MVDAARGVLNQLLADVYIFTDAMSGAAAGASPGYGLTLVAETTTGCLVSAEAAATQVGMRLHSCAVGSGDLAFYLTCVHVQLLLGVRLLHPHSPLGFEPVLCVRSKAAQLHCFPATLDGPIQAVDGPSCLAGTY